MTLVPMRDSGCPECRGPLVSQVIWQPALFRHGGYGATRRTTVDVCFGCGWSHVGAIEEVHPLDGIRA